MWRAALSIVLAAAVSGCASDYVARTAPARAEYQHYDYKDAIGAFKRQVAKGPERDRLLALLDEGMVEHACGDWGDSIQAFTEADEVASSLDVTSIHEEAEVLISGERQKAYRGEDFEQLMISVLQGLNYAMLGKDEDALVEERRVNERLLKMTQDEKRPYQQLAIARYLSGVLYEDQGKLDDALIDYRAALVAQPQLGVLAEPLVRIAKERDRADVLKDLSAQFPGITGVPLGDDEGQLLVVVEEGLAPRKIPGYNKQRDPGSVISIPVFVDRGQTVPPQVSLDGGPWAPSVMVTDLSEVAMRDLGDRMGKLLLKQLAGAAVKAGIAAGAAALTKSAGVGWLTFWALGLSNQPDLRSWMSLPAQFDLMRFRLPKGTHTVTLSQRGYQLQQQIEVVPHRISLWVVRQY